MRHLSGYIQALFFAVMFLLFINGSIGWALLYVLLGTGILSVATLLFSRKNFRIDMECVSGLSEKGGRTELRVTVTKTGFCFIPNLDITVQPTRGETVSVRTALTFSRSSSVIVPIKARISGKNRCFVTECVMQDFWSLLRLSKNPENVFADFCVLPAIIDYDGPLVKPKILPSEEDSEEGKTALSGGLPGYEHRDYEAGDSLRRINYKLSAKRGKLMVRLDETSGSAPVVIAVSENCFPEAGETLLALAKSLIMRGGTVRVEQNGESFCASSPQTLSRLREWIAARPLTFSESGKGLVLPPDTDVVFDENGVNLVAAQPQ